MLPHFQRLLMKHEKNNEQKMTGLSPLSCQPLQCLWFPILKTQMYDNIAIYFGVVKEFQKVCCRQWHACAISWHGVGKCKQGYCHSLRLQANMKRFLSPRTVLDVESKIWCDEESGISHSKNAPINSGMFQGAGERNDFLVEMNSSAQYFDQACLCALWAWRTASPLITLKHKVTELWPEFLACIKKAVH